MLEQELVLLLEGHDLRDLLERAPDQGQLLPRLRLLEGFLEEVDVVYFHLEELGPTGATQGLLLISERDLGTKN